MSETDKHKVAEATFSSIYEFYKQLQDYYKTLITVNTACILVMVAFLEKIFPHPKIKMAVLASFACFAISLAASLLMMTFISEFFDHIISVRIFHLDILASQQNQSEKLDSERNKIDAKGNKIAKKQKWAYPISNYFFFLGIIILVLFIAVNFLRK